MRSVLTIGTFDLFHYGHLNLLQQCAELGDVTVGVNSDEFVEQYKGAAPVQSYDERCRMIDELGYYTKINASAGKELIERTSPDILAIGSDWATKDYLKQIDVTQEWLDEQGIMLLYIPYTKGISSTELKRRIHERDSDSIQSQPPVVARGLSCVPYGYICTCAFRTNRRLRAR